MSILGRAIRQIRPVNINRRKPNGATTAVSIDRDRQRLGLGACVRGLVARQVVGQHGKVGGERQGRQSLGRPLLLRIAPVPLLDPQPGPPVRDDARQAIRVAVAVEQPVVRLAVVGRVWAAEGPVAVGYLDSAGVVAVRVDGGLEVRDGESCWEGTALGGVRVV